MNPDEENAACEAPEEVSRISLLLCCRIVRSNLWHVAVPGPDSAMQFLQSHANMSGSHFAIPRSLFCS